jgi:hypothetical protein
LKYVTNCTPWSRVFLEKLIVAQLVKKFQPFMELEGSELPLDPVLSQMKPVHTSTSRFKLSFNIMHSSTPRSPKSFLTFYFSN